eukprot:6481705-Pyramimonas_sp.AAC.1
MSWYGASYVLYGASYVLYGASYPGTEPLMSWYGASYVLYGASYVLVRSLLSPLAAFGALSKVRAHEPRKPA